jgi:DNA-directed RNA polymerase specialized sigma24 family protein
VVIESKAWPGTKREVPLAGGETASTDTPSRRAMAREQDEQPDRSVRQLPEHYRQVLFLHTSENLTFAQIAEKLGNTTDGVRKLWARAVDEPAELLEASKESTARRYVPTGGLTPRRSPLRPLLSLRPRLRPAWPC